MKGLRGFNFLAESQGRVIQRFVVSQEDNSAEDLQRMAEYLRENQPTFSEFCLKLPLFWTSDWDFDPLLKTFVHLNASTLRFRVQLDNRPRFLIFSSLPELCRAVSFNPYIRILDLSYCVLTSLDMPALCRALVSNTSITSLDLSRNSLGDGGAKLIGDALDYHCTITHLTLHWTGITNMAVGYLLQNHSLRSLDVSNNHIEADNYVVSELAQNHIITSFDYDDHNLAYPDPRIARQLAANRSRCVMRNDKARDLLVALLGLRKQKRVHCGLLANQPREMVIWIGKLVWQMRHWSGIKN